MLVWCGGGLLGLTLAFWARYAMDRFSEDERVPRLGPPVALTAVLVVLFVAVSMVSDG